MTKLFALTILAVANIVGALVSAYLDLIPILGISLFLVAVLIQLCILGMIISDASADSD